jgi:hypothetical protein
MALMPITGSRLVAIAPDDPALHCVPADSWLATGSGYLTLPRRRAAPGWTSAAHVTDVATDVIERRLRFDTDRDLG